MSHVVWFVAFLTFLPGCESARFYSQAVRGQMQIRLRERPLAKVLADTNIPAARRERLQRVADLCAFAATELRLPARHQYRKYADLGRPYVVWNVFAAPEFSLEARTWWYPVVGRLEYRGYFREALARDYAQHLKAAGDDVFVGPVRAYSTLGWLRDPVLNTWIDDTDTGLAELVFHELAHRRLFISGDTDFNEAFATATARLGTRQWLRRTGGPDLLAAYEEALREESRFSAAVRTTRRQLTQLYAEKAPAPAGRLAPSNPPQLTADQLATLRARKTELLEALQAQFPSRFHEMPNHARLNQIDTYDRLVPAFEILFRRCGSDWETYYAAVRGLGRRPAAERQAELEDLGQMVFP